MLSPVPFQGASQAFILKDAILRIQTESPKTSLRGESIKSAPEYHFKVWPVFW